MNDLIEWLARDSVALAVVCGVLGLLFGSFFNVVIHRLPRMLEAEWRQEYAEFSGEPAAAPAEPFNLLTPRSRCPHCGHPISALENIPLLSWLALRGRCRACAAPIGIRYPLVELLADAVLGAAAGYLLLWSVYHAFRLVTGKEGMGYGDFKLLAALGAWLGWQMLPLIILLSAVAGSVLGLGLILLAGRDRARPLPFGPYLAVGGFVALLWGRTLTEWYLGT